MPEAGRELMAGTAPAMHAAGLWGEAHRSLAGVAACLSGVPHARSFESKLRQTLLELRKWTPIFHHRRAMAASSSQEAAGLAELQTLAGRLGVWLGRVQAAAEVLRSETQPVVWRADRPRTPG